VRGVSRHDFLPSSNIDCAPAVHEWNVFIASGLASSEKQIPQITLETKIRERTIGEDSGSLQAGGRRFDPGHVHHISS
jgi:hypothetical protein